MDDLLRREPLTPEQLAALRMVEQRELGDDAPARYTCDDCPIAARCTLAFNSYSVDGDCLAEK